MLGVSIPASRSDSWCVPTLPSSCFPHPSPPQDWRLGAAGRDEGRKGAGTAESWAGWADILGGGRVLGSPVGEPRRGCCTSPSPPPAAAGTAPRPASRAGGARGTGPGAPGAPPPRAAGEQRPAAAARRLGASHGDQSERGWLGGKPREAFVAAWVAAGSCRDGPRCSGLTVSSSPRREGPRPAAGPPPPGGFRANKMESRWSPRGARSLARLSRGIGASPRPRRHTHRRRVAPAGRAAVEGAVARRADARADQPARPRGRGRRGGGARRRPAGSSLLGPAATWLGLLRASPFRGACGSPWRDPRETGGSLGPPPISVGT